ncbi:hypothetical protein JOS77_20470 [Chromobacterium haemolyticum]|nr:hypothetical protein JOS77_20470 [Chromobacterium haemolyticum]
MFDLLARQQSQLMVQRVARDALIERIDVFFRAFQYLQKVVVQHQQHAGDALALVVVAKMADALMHGFG